MLFVFFLQPFPLVFGWLKSVLCISMISNWVKIIEIKKKTTSRLNWNIGTEGDNLTESEIERERDREAIKHGPFSKHWIPIYCYLIIDYFVEVRVKLFRTGFTGRLLKTKNNQKHWMTVSPFIWMLFIEAKFWALFLILRLWCLLCKLGIQSHTN